jgi:predicted ATPase
MEMVVTEALAEDNPLSICYVIVECALPIALLVRDHEAARRYRAILHSAAERHGSMFWSHLDRCYAALLSTSDVMDAQNLSTLRQGIDELHSMAFDTYSVDLRNRLAHALYSVGRVDEALAMTIQTIKLVDETGERLWEADLLRAKAVFASHSRTSPALAEAERDLMASIDMARGQGALSLELRSAKDLANVLSAQDRREEARRILTAVYDRFTEGHHTPDLLEARELMASLG